MSGGWNRTSSERGGRRRKELPGQTWGESSKKAEKGDGDGKKAGRLVPATPEMNQKPGVEVRQVHSTSPFQKLGRLAEERRRK